MKVELEDVKRICGLNGVPSTVDMNKNVVLDNRLFEALRDENYTYRNRRYDFDVFLPDYGIKLQRDYVWNDCQRTSFIENILLEKPIEEFVIVEHEFKDGSKVKQVIDGKQRLTTVSRFIRDSFSIWVGENVRFSDFSDELKMYFRSRVNSFTARVYYSDWAAPVSDKVKILLFNYYNFSGTPQTEQHKDRLMRIIGYNEVDNIGK